MSKDFEDRKRENFLKLVELSDELETFDLKFDIYAQDPNDWDWLSQIIPGLCIYSAGGALPFQAEGLINGHPFYYRERHGTARLNIGEIDGEMPYLNKAVYTASEEVEEFRRGPEWIATFINLLENLKKAPFQYEFSGNEVILANDGVKNPDSISTAEGVVKIHKFWGDTSEEALKYHYENSKAMLVDHFKWPLDYFNKMMELEDINPIPLNRDERIISEPNFEVRLPDALRNADGRVEISASDWLEGND